MRALTNRFIGLENLIHRELVRYSLVALRVSVGAVFLGFGVLKYFPGVSPAEDLAMKTTDLLTFGLVPGSAQFIGILSPIVLLTGRLFSGPHHAPTLEGQYVLKDIILVTAGMVIAAATFRGGRLVRDEPPLVPPARANGNQTFDAERKLQIVLEGVRDDCPVSELCDRHGISQAVYYDWRDHVLDGATRSLAQRETVSAT